MSTYTFYIHHTSGDIATLADWRADFESMDIESWFGLPAEECEGLHWIDDLIDSQTGAQVLQPIELTSDDECFLTNYVFPGWHGDAAEGEEYTSQWQVYAEDSDGERYLITWGFPAVKGQEPEDDGDWPWDNEQYMSVERI